MGGKPRAHGIEKLLSSMISVVSLVAYVCDRYSLEYPKNELRKATATPR